MWDRKTHSLKPLGIGFERFHVLVFLSPADLFSIIMEFSAITVLKRMLGNKTSLCWHLFNLHSEASNWNFTYWHVYNSLTAYWWWRFADAIWLRRLDRIRFVVTCTRQPQHDKLVQVARQYAAKHLRSPQMAADRTWPCEEREESRTKTAPKSRKKCTLATALEPWRDWTAKDTHCTKKKKKTLERFFILHIGSRKICIP